MSSLETDRLYTRLRCLQDELKASRQGAPDEMKHRIIEKQEIETAVFDLVIQNWIPFAPSYDVAIKIYLIIQFVFGGIVLPIYSYKSSLDYPFNYTVAGAVASAVVAVIVVNIISLALVSAVIDAAAEKVRPLLMETIFDELEKERRDLYQWNFAQRKMQEARAEEQERLERVRLYEERQRREEREARALRLKTVEDSFFAAWRRFQGAVDFDGSMPKPEVKKLFRQKIHTLPIWSHEDRGLLAESQNPLIRDILGNVFYSLPAPPK